MCTVRLLLFLFVLLCLPDISQAQYTCPTAPVGANDTRCASTAFVANAVGGGATFTVGDLVVGGPSSTQIRDASTASVISWSTSTGPIGASAVAVISFDDGFDVTGAGTSYFAELGAIDTIKAGATGNHIAMHGVIYAPNALSSAGGNLTGGWFFTDVVANLGGTSGTHAGGAFGSNPQALCSSAATFMIECTGEEVDVTNNSTSTTARIGINVVAFGPAVQGTSTDAAILVGANATSAQWNFAYYASNFNGNVFPIASTGTYIGISAGTVAHGIDLSNLTCTSDCFKGPSFSIDGSGNLSAATLTPTSTTPSANGLFLNSANVLGFEANSTQLGFWSVQEFAFSTSANRNQIIAVINANAGTATQSQFWLGNSSSNSEATFSLNGGSFSGGHGANALTITSAGNFWITGGSTDAVEIDSSGNPYLPSLANATTAKTGSVCWNTGGGALTYDNTNTCLVSDADLKDIEGPLTGCLDKIKSIRSIKFFYKDRAVSPEEHAGFTAQNIDAVDPLFAARNEQGKPVKVRYIEMDALWNCAIQEQEARIEALEARLH